MTRNPPGPVQFVGHLLRDQRQRVFPCEVVTYHVTASRNPARGFFAMNSSRSDPDQYLLAVCEDSGQPPSPAATALDPARAVEVAVPKKITRSRPNDVLHRTRDARAHRKLLVAALP